MTCKEKYDCIKNAMLEAQQMINDGWKLINIHDLTSINDLKNNYEIKIGDKIISLSYGGMEYELFNFDECEDGVDDVEEILEEFVLVPDHKIKRFQKFAEGDYKWAAKDDEVYKDIR